MISFLNSAVPPTPRLNPILNLIISNATDNILVSMKGGINSATGELF